MATPSVPAAPTGGRPGCPFCEIVAGRSPASIVHQDDRVIAFLNLNQATPGMVLVLPTAHVSRIHELTDRETGTRLLEVVSSMARAIERTFGLTDVNVVQNNGASAGQEVFHLHFHVVPRQRNDGFGLAWPQRRPTRETLNRIAARLRLEVDLPALPEAPVVVARAQDAVRSFLAEHELLRDPSAIALDLAAEVGELAKEVLKGSDYGARPFEPRDTMAGEIGDVLYSALVMAERLGLDADVLVGQALAKYASRLEDAGSPGSER